MKRLKCLLAIVMASLIVLSFSGCSFRIASFDNLIRPPKLSGEYQGLQDAFETSVDSGFDLKTPESGDYQSAFITYDVDSDSQKEAIVFYSTVGQSDNVKFYYFEYNDGNWIPVGSYDGLGNSVSQVIFSDIDKDGKSEIIIGWGLFSSKTNKVFGVYKPDKDKMTMLNSYPYTYIDVIDVNGDGFDDIFTLTLDSSVPDRVTACARAYNYTDKNVVDIISEVKTDGNISSYYSVSVEEVDEHNLIYIEANKGENEMITEIVYWDEKSNSLVAPLFDADSQSTKLTWRKNKVISADIDSDKFLEIPISVEMPGSSVTSTTNSNIAAINASVSQSIYYTKWVKFRDNRLRPVQYSIINDKFGYMLNIQSSWVGRVTVIGADGQWDFYRWNSSTGKVGELLFSIKCYDRTKTESSKFKDYKELSTVGNNTFVYSITNAGNDFGVRNYILEKNFITTNYGGIS